MTTDAHRCAPMGQGTSHDALTQAVIGGAFAVQNELGVGFLEKVYENALTHELRKKGMAVRQQWPVAVRYDGVVVGDYVADLVVEDRVLVELKVAKAIDQAHVAQALNYLKATGLTTCLILNFGSARVDVKRLSL